MYKNQGASGTSSLSLTSWPPVTETESRDCLSRDRGHLRLWVLAHEAHRTVSLPQFQKDPIAILINTSQG